MTGMIMGYSNILLWNTRFLNKDRVLRFYLNKFLLRFGMLSFHYFLRCSLMVAGVAGGRVGRVAGDRVAGGRVAAPSFPLISSMGGFLLSS